jgi:hypothetical protein
MRRGHAFVLLQVTAALLGGGCRSSPRSAEPGDEIGTMTLVRGTEHQADEEIFAYCNAVISKARRYHRSCNVPRARLLFVGYGDWERTRGALNSAWKQLKWDLWLDGRQVRLSRFGSAERLLYAFPPAGGKTVILREWSVILVGATPGKHTLRYRRTSRSVGTTDATWTFTVGQ